MGRNYKQYHKKIDAILRRLDGGQPSDTELDHIESDLNGLADSYQTDEALGTSRYKLYAAQASIEYYRGNDQRSRAFMEEAVRIKGASFTFAEEFLGQLPPPKSQWLTALDRLSAWQAALIVAVVGFGVFFTGLTNPFMGDDQEQIVDNPVVHSISNVRLFFEGSTSYIGNGIAPLSGFYYRPMMTTIFSLLYTLFGPHTLAFHLFQLLLYISSVFLLYLIFRHSFSSILSLLLSLIFLVHPLNSQDVFAIPTMQDVLMFFFGTLSMWLLLRFHSVRSLVFVALSLLLTLLSKEAGALFIVMAMIYLFWFDRKRLSPFVGIIVIPIVLWLVLRIHAVGLFSHQFYAPIDQLSLAGRLLTVPSILLFYITKFVFPLHLASGYYWSYPSFSFGHVLLPFVIDSIVVGLIVYLAVAIRSRVSDAMFYMYLFFGIWAALGILVYLQLLPLDFTACEAWFYFAMAGVLGMIGVVLTAFDDYVNPIWFLVITVALIGVLGIRTAARGTDWSNQYKLAYKDISLSQDDWVAENTVAIGLFAQGKLMEAKSYAVRSVNADTLAGNTNTLGTILAAQGDYDGARNMYMKGLRYQEDRILRDNIARIVWNTSDPSLNRQFLLNSVKIYPQDATLWLGLAIVEYSKFNDKVGAQTAIKQAYNLDSNSSNPDDALINNVYGQIMSNQPITIQLTHSFTTTPYH